MYVVTKLADPIGYDADRVVVGDMAAARAAAFEMGTATIYEVSVRHVGTVGARTGSSRNLSAVREA